jgi:uncharacterized DUF497 family protein
MIDDVIYKGRYIWNRKKNELTKKQHEGLSFETAVIIFDTPFIVIEYDEKNSGDEDRYKVRGYLGASGFSYITVTFTNRGDMKRIISARKADSEEQEVYNENVRWNFGIRD